MIRAIVYLSCTPFFLYTRVYYDKSLLYLITPLGVGVVSLIGKVLLKLLCYIETL